MENRQIVVPKAAFAARLLRPDPTSVSQDEIGAFHTLLERVLSHCSPTNIQICKAWLLRFVAFSSSRVGGLANYLEALAASIEQPQSTGSKGSPKRRRLHILYLLNDLLHHCKYHLELATVFPTVSGSLQPHIVNLVGHAAAYDRQKNPRHHQRLDDLLDLWSEHGYFHPALITKLRETVITPASMGLAPSSEEANPAKKSGKHAPFVVPSTHGDPWTPWCDLASGNLFPHIIPNSTMPLHPGDTKPIHLLAGPAEGKSVDTLKGFFIAVDNFLGTRDLEDNGHKDTDEFGQMVLRDSLIGERYHAWTPESCQQANKDSGDSSSESLSQSGERTPKRRRYSDSSSSPSYTPPAPSTSHFPPPHQPQHAPIPTAPFPRAHNPNGQYPNHPMAPNAGYPPQTGTNYGVWPPPQHMPNMPYPQPGPGFQSSAFPPPYNHQPSSSMPMPQGQGQGQGQAMPPGQYHFPPPYSGGQQGGAWRPPQGGRRW
ncbi:RNA polymerase II large subunit CTD [Penicillium paradoxum]|uniref:RNA polymerase II large subunit CTD n=1 Tax=Penicillium paradoxum TaxID=176176 RepID=UPI002548828B|nr:RNA polymerase II large subunit CTD [Penicillium paradoxum]KAJ5795203.1 RNA polymerase II large subunit CTD [Penicillium paradoxum]